MWLFFMNCTLFSQQKKGSLALWLFEKEKGCVSVVHNIP
jgi:hypothetical protein